MNLNSHIQSALNLSDHELALYLAGLQFDHATLSDLARAAGIVRTAAYPPLKSLVNQGLMSAITIGKRTHYRSVEPQHLLALYDQKRTVLEQAIDTLSQHIRAPSAKFSAQYFSGTHGMQVAANMFLNESKSSLWRSFENPAYPLEKTDEQSFDAHITKRVEKGIRARGIISGDATRVPWIKQHIENAEKILAEVVVVSPTDYPINASIGIDDEQVLLVSASAVPFAVLIKNADIARTLASVHDMIWDRYRR